MTDKAHSPEYAALIRRLMLLANDIQFVTDPAKANAMADEMERLDAEAEALLAEEETK